MTTLVKVPLRLTLAGGGTDLPAHYRKYGGIVLSAAIDKWITVSISKYPGALDPPHPYLLASGWSDEYRSYIESDVPSGSGLGGSGALLVGCLHARHPETPLLELAMAAYNIERYSLDVQCGCQDHVVASLGGCVLIGINDSGRVFVNRTKLPKLADRLLLFHTAIVRSAKPVLKSQAANIASGTGEGYMRQVHDIGSRIIDDLKETGGANFGPLTNEHWLAKKATSPLVSTPDIDRWYEVAMENGAEGFKCCGAGGGGYVLVVCHPHTRRRVTEAMTLAGLVHTPFKFVQQGVHLL